MGHIISSEYFEETINTRGFDQESLWGNIGGYVGMVLGYSLLQVPDIISTIYDCVLKIKLNIMRSLRTTEPDRRLCDIA